jgi:uncharacterized protein YegP (UPF0339 family)
MATATKKSGATTGANRGADVASNSVSMEFLIVEANGGDYHWTLLDRDGNSFARSPSFASYEQAENAARVVLAGAGSARLDCRATAGSSIDIPTKPKVPMTGENVDGAKVRFKPATGVVPATRAKTR